MPLLGQRSFVARQDRLRSADGGEGRRVPLHGQTGADCQPHRVVGALERADFVKIVYTPHQAAQAVAPGVGALNIANYGEEAAAHSTNGHARCSYKRDRNDLD